MILSEDAGVGAHDLVGVSVVSKDAEHGFGATCSRPVVGHLQVLSVASEAKMISMAEIEIDKFTRVFLLPKPQRAPATHRHARDSAGRPGAGRGGMNGNKEGRASRADGRGRNGSRGQSVMGLSPAGVRKARGDGKKEPDWSCSPS